jgi:hypothetical protein
MRSAVATSIIKACALTALIGAILVARPPGASGDDLQLWTVVTVDQKIVDRLEGGIQTRVRLIDDVSLARDVVCSQNSSATSDELITADNVVGQAASRQRYRW